MYKTGDLEVTTKKCETWRGFSCDKEYEKGHIHWMTDSRERIEHETEGIVYLPHSCGEWVIGGEEQVKNLIKDLQSLLKKSNK